MQILLVILGITGVFVLIAALWAVSSYNKLIHGKNLVDEGWSGIDVQLNRTLA